MIELDWLSQYGSSRYQEKCDTVNVRTRDLAGIFLKLGVTGFGGPAAHIALMREEFVRRRGWMEDAEFLELVGIANLIPGPNSTELAMHIGSQKAGRRGLVISGVCFIVPAVVIVAFFAWLYERYGTSPTVVDVRYGVLPVIIAIVAHALLGLGKNTLTSSSNVIIALSAFVLYLTDFHELLILVFCGALAVVWARWEQRSDRSLELGALFLLFLQVGAVLYGSGYVLLAFLEQRLVDDLGWLTSQELLDAVAIGQITPGPLFSTATFIGWQIAGFWGAMVSTVGIFLPSFIFVATLFVIVPWVKRHVVIQQFVSGVTIASLGLMAGVLVELTGDALIDWFTVLIALSALLYLLVTKWNATWIILTGVTIGIAKHLV